LTNKFTNSLSILPSWTKTPSIQSLDINDIPVFTFAIVDGSREQNDENKIAMKKIGNAIMDDLHAIPNVSAEYLVGGADNDVNITVDLDKLEAKNTDLMQVYTALKQANVQFPGGSFQKGGVNNVINVDTSLTDTDKIGNIVVNLVGNSPILLNDVATISRGSSVEKSKTFINTGSGAQNAVYISVAKKK
jgi:multidrug efflux pump subunit AcrB